MLLDELQNCPLSVTPYLISWRVEACWGIFILSYSCFLISPSMSLDLCYFYIDTIALALHILVRLWMLYCIHVLMECLFFSIFSPSCTKVTVLSQSFYWPVLKNHQGGPDCGHCDSHTCRCTGGVYSDGCSPSLLPEQRADTPIFPVPYQGTTELVPLRTW